jgi:4-amino-4-deoxy-L-arabinose transferase-like glycosyltransferase
LFARGLYRPEEAPLWAWVFGHRMPLMQMAYLGSLKAWLYQPLFWLFGTSPALIRLPMLAAGAATIWIWFLVVRRIAGEKPALFMAALLATDPVFLWTTRCDWGPVAIQHLLAALGSWMLFRFHDSRRDRWLACAFFLFGLALWDKTVFLWWLFGTAMALLVVWRVVRPLLGPRRILVAAFCLAAGAYPLLRYNFRSSGETVRQTASFAIGKVPERAAYLRHYLDGGGLFGYLVHDAHVWPKRGWGSWVFLAALAAVPWLGLPGRAAAAALAGSWGLMAATAGAGESSHHVVLVWPLPQILIGLALARVRPPAMAAAIVAATVVASLAVCATYYRLLVERSTPPPWSDAIYGLDRELTSMRPARVRAPEWGIANPLLLLSGGRLPVRHDTSPHYEAGDVVVSHAATGPLRGAAETVPPARCALRLVRVIQDREGTGVFQIMRCE